MGTAVAFVFTVLKCLLLVTTLVGLCCAKTCTFVNDNRQTNDEGENAALQRLKPLVGKRYEVSDPFDVKYKYSVGICTTALPDQADEAIVGAVQLETDPTTKKTTVYKLGELDKAKIVAGTDWIFLEYGGGKTYGHHCGKEPRRALIMITCDGTVSDNNAYMELIEENKNMSSGCYYLFELSHKAICPASKASNLSLGSIFIIVLISVIGVYLFFGFLYQRFVLGAKGMEQIPNYSFWQDFGNLQADGCNFVCRSGGTRGPRTYKGVGDDQLDDMPETDDHLLPM